MERALTKGEKGKESKKKGESNTLQLSSSSSSLPSLFFLLSFACCVRFNKCLQAGEAGPASQAVQAYPYVALVLLLLQATGGHRGSEHSLRRDGSVGTS
jgi:hypothetical protein